MVQEMTQFSTQTLSYDNPYLLPHLKLDSQFWHSPTQHLADPPEINGDSERSDTAHSYGSSPPASHPKGTVSSAGKKKRTGKKSGSSKSSYKHVPHREKPPHLVARRNARERRRVQAVNSAFSRLRKCVPAESKSKRLSKVKTLHRAIEYIQMLQEMLSNGEGTDEHHMMLGVDNHLCGSTGGGGDSLNKENELHQRWLQLPTSWGADDNNSCMSFYDDFGDTI